jgi:DNA-binding transcriptional LysR family regulator
MPFVAPITSPISSDMLSAFLKVAECLSVSTAAQELGVGKSLVSKRVAQLEGKVEATLFSRSTRKVALTPAGEAYVELAEMSAGEEHLRAMRSELTGRIRLTSSVSWGQHVLAKHLPEFLRSHPAIEIDLHLSDQMIDLAEQRIDIALRWSPARLSGFRTLPVAQIGWVLTASPYYLEQVGAPGTPANLAEHACFCYWRERSDDSWVFERRSASTRRKSERLQVRVSSRYHVNNPESVRDAAIQGLGIALLPDYLCHEALQAGQLVRVLSEWIPLTKFGTLISALATPERLLLSRNRVLLEFLRESCAPL